MTGIRTSKRAHEPRKRPSQARSHATVDAIIEAAAQVFEAKGYLETTTDLVAARAGVSIGTLYQYFPSKDALLVALFERHVDAIDKAFAAIEERLTTHPPVDEAAQALVSVAFALNSDRPRLHRILIEDAPLPARLLERYRAVASKMSAAWARYLEGRVADPALVASMTIASIEAMAHRLAVYPIEGRTPAELAAETVRMLAAYIRNR